MKTNPFKFTFWKAVAILTLAAGAAATWLRVTGGLGASTNLTDATPWGLWVAFDILCGVGLAAGGFTMAAIVHIFHIKRFEPMLRPAILTAFLGYLLVIVGLMFDLGRPFSVWHAIIMWNPNSVMFEVAWCVMLYTTVLAMEFAPVVLERFRLFKLVRIMGRVSIVFIILGVLLSTLHQSSLGSLFLIVPGKMYGLWYSAYLPAFFYVSAIAAGCAMVIFESYLSSRAFGRGLEMHLLQEIGRVCVMVLGVYLVMKVVDLASRDMFGLLLLPRKETAFYWAELVVGVIAPMLWLGRAKVRANYHGLFAGAVMVVVGFVFNRLNVATTALERSAGVAYVPKWSELAITMSIVTVGFIAFALAARYLPIFTDEHGHAREEESVVPVAWVEDAGDARRQAPKRGDHGILVAK
ncbi:MAG: Ni/Fe-hydrogenase cytochrome b subunit [Candidatus Eisenbacteria bacterium]|nr:Ni/Fe-hydrogenase cytochrome b subunit [Candidatus Eisenbacteria bacterium]